MTAGARGWSAVPCTTLWKIGDTTNGSLWGVAARLQTGHVRAATVTDLSWTWIVILATVLVAVAIRTRRLEGVARWAAAMLAATLASSRLADAGMSLLCLPHPVLLLATRSVWSLRLAGSTAALGVLLLWVAWVRAPSVKASPEARDEHDYPPPAASFGA